MLYFVLGDIGHIMENDCFVITDRLKELIKYKGLQVMFILYHFLKFFQRKILIIFELFELN